MPPVRVRLDRVVTAAAGGALALAPEAPRQLAGLVVPWGVPLDRYGVPAAFYADVLRLPEELSTVKLLVQHDQERPVGYAVDASIGTDGLRMTFALPPHERADAVLDEADALLRDGLSVGVELDGETLMAINDAWWADDPPAEPIPLAGTLREVSLVSVPAYNDARVGAAARLATFSSVPRKEAAMPPVPTPAPAPDVETDPVPAPLALADLAAQLAPLLAAQQENPHHLATFMSLAAAYDAVYEGRIERFALVDQTTPNNPGVIPPAWLQEVQGIIATDRPTVTALGGPQSAPSDGMEVTWPYYDGDIKTLVGEQLTEKSEITSVRVDLKRASVGLRTFAGGSDISYQLLRRSSPEYRAAYMQLLLSGYDYVTDYAFVSAVVAAGTAGPSWDEASGADGLRATLFSASSQVRTATGGPATTVVASDDVWQAIGGLPGLYPGQYGTNNVSGTADASSLSVNVSGLSIVNDPWAPPGTLVVTNGRAARWIEDGPFTATAEDVARLGQDNAVWGMGTAAIYNARGVVKVAVTLTAPPAPLAETQRRGR